MIEVRRATLADAPGAARVQVDGWRFTYAGVMTDEFLASLSYEAAEESWRQGVLRNDPEETFLVALRDGAVVGMLIGGAPRFEVPGYPHELWGLYTQPGLQRAGIGRALFEFYKESLRARGAHHFHLWAGRQNTRAHAFYEAMGGRKVTERSDRLFGGTRIVEFGFGFKV